jgi:membrane-associated phospholipid phosphatase
MTMKIRAATPALALAAILGIAASAEAQAVVPAAVPTVAAAPVPSFASLFTRLPADVRRLPTLGNAAWLGVTGVLAAAVEDNDPRITRRAVGSLRLESALDSGAALGGGYAQIGAALAVYFGGRLAHHPHLAGVGADLVRAQLLDTVLTQGIKVAVDRPRPDGSRYSFPSGHTSSAFATATVLYRHFGWKAGVPATAMATYVAASRLTENRHYLSDVLFGAGVGIVSGRAVTVGRGSERFALSPALYPHGVGLSVVRIGAE